MQTVLIHCFGYSIFSLRKLIFDQLKVVVRECQLPMIMVVSHIPSVKGVFPSVEWDETLHIIDGTSSKCITIPFISDALDWCYGDGCIFSNAHEDFMLMLNKQTKRKKKTKKVSVNP